MTIAGVRVGHVPFFFKPLHFVIFDPLTVILFSGLTWTAHGLLPGNSARRRWGP
jgi:hypothetical protein